MQWKTTYIFQIDRHEFVFHRQFGGFDARQVDQIVDQAQHLPGTGFQMLQRLHLAPSEGAIEFILQDLTDHQDTAERRAQIVADVGQDRFEYTRRFHLRKI